MIQIEQIRVDDRASVERHRVCGQRRLVEVEADGRGGAAAPRTGRASRIRSGLGPLCGSIFLAPWPQCLLPR